MSESDVIGKCPPKQADVIINYLKKGWEASDADIDGDVLLKQGGLSFFVRPNGEIYP